MADNNATSMKDFEKELTLSTMKVQFMVSG